VNKLRRPRLVTIMVVPHGGGRTYQVRVPISLFRRLLAGFVLFCAAALAFVRSYSAMRGNMVELERLRHEAASQHVLLQSLSGRAAALREHEARVAGLAEQVPSLLEDDAFLPPHLKVQLLGALRGLSSLSPGALAPHSAVQGPAEALPAGEGAESPRIGTPSEEAESGSAPGAPVSPFSPDTVRRAGPLASRAMNREWTRGAARARAGGTLAEAASPLESGTQAPDGQGPGSWSGEELDRYLDRSISSAEACADCLALLGRVLARRQEALLSLPQCLPIEGRLTSGFGYRRSPFGRRSEFHEGVDLAAPRGTPVRVVADGVVVFAGYKPGLGRTVVVDHGNGVETVYGHHSRLLVSAGQRVSAGEVIAAVGDSGRSTGDHLHFELRFNGKAVDPWPYLKRLGGGD